MKRATTTKLLAVAALVVALVSVSGPAAAKNADWLAGMCQLVGGKYNLDITEWSDGTMLVIETCEWETDDGGSWIITCADGSDCIGGYSPFPPKPDIYRPEDPCEFNANCDTSTELPDLPRSGPLTGPEPSTEPPSSTEPPGSDPEPPPSPNPGEDPAEPDPCQVNTCQVPVEPTQYDPIVEPTPDPIDDPGPVQPRCPKLLCLDDPIDPRP